MEKSGMGRALMTTLGPEDSLVATQSLRRRCLDQENSGTWSGSMKSGAPFMTHRLAPEMRFTCS